MGTHEPSTPVKQTTFGCVLCLDIKPRRTYKLSGDKCQAEKVVYSIKTLTGVDVKNLSETWQDMSICRPCLGRIQNFTTFRTVAIESMHVVQKRKQVVKRHSSNSPVQADCSVTSTPTSSGTSAKKKLRRQLILSTISIKPTGIVPLVKPAPQAPTPTNENQHSSTGTTISSDHSYSFPKPENNPQPCAKAYEMLRCKGLQGDDRYCSEHTQLSKEEIQTLMTTLQQGDIPKLSTVIHNITPLYMSVKKEVLKDTTHEFTSLLSRSPSLETCLGNLGKVHHLTNIDSIIEEVLTEMQDRYILYLKYICKQYKNYSPYMFQY